MNGIAVSGALLLFALCWPATRPSGQVLNCQEVRSSFQSLYPGMKGAPEAPVTGSDLQVCQPKGLTCCTRKMEERYLMTAKQSMESNLQAASAQLKLLIIQNAALFQEAFDVVLRVGRNATLLMLREEFPALVTGGSVATSGAYSAVGQLFQDVSLYILGSDARVDHMVTVFSSRLFPLAYRRLLGGGATAVAGGSSSSSALVTEECLREAWTKGPGGGVFGSYPKLLMTRLSRSLLATRVFLQALNLGIEVINTTQHLRAGRECGRTLLRLWYCPHCQGLLDAGSARLCPALCLGAMQGCLGGAAEVQPHWRSFVDGLGRLVEGMRGEQDVEAVALGIPALVRSALRHALANKNRIATVVSGVCAKAPAKRVSRSVIAPAPRPPRAVPVIRHHPQPLDFDPEETLSGRRRKFISGLRGFSSFYSGLGEALCSREPAALNDSLCWNGQEMTDKFPGPGLKKSSHGSESRNSNKPPEPVISQIIDKLKHINQLLRMVTVSEKRWRARPGGGAVRRDRDGQGDGVGGAAGDTEGLSSGDCGDDEDDCSAASGLGLPPQHKLLRIFSDDLAMDGFTYKELLLTPRLATDSHSSRGVGPSVRGGAGRVCGLSPALLLLPLLLLLLPLMATTTTTTSTLIHLQPPQ
ncbi:glypican-3 [Engraulis encrasicolus]|uniref:glypican-3 n=1 Tax=Engraulis encrasicolus TaxID=184585 RepID=UPI002FD25FCE